jgi:uncharacterized membrane protein
MSSFEIAAILCIGLLLGTELAVSVFINPIVWQLDETAQATAIRLFATRLGKAMPFWYAVSLIFLIVEAVLYRHQATLPLLIAACVIWAAVILLTLLFLVPINNRMMRLAANSFPEAERQQHKKWDARHRLRIAALGASFLCFLIAIR